MSGTPTVTDFAATGTIEAFIVPATGTYYVVAYGAQGGDGDLISGTTGDINTGGGLGAQAGADFLLLKGETLDVAVGVEGTGEGGGGGSFVVLVNQGVATPLVVAGGGGDTTAPTANAGAGPAGSGQGSAVDYGGAGFYSNGAGTETFNTAGGEDYFQSAGPGEDFANMLRGGMGSVSIVEYHPGGYLVRTDAGDGGFGGGGGNGGGGGYTGGDPGEGGTSYLDPAAVDPNVIGAVQSGNGEIQITYPACFAAGTRLATPDGYVAVETLRVGDLVLSARRQRAVPVTWVGSRRVAFSTAPNPAWVCPVRITAGAFGPGRPTRDLFLSPDHAVYAGGVLIPVRVLVNGDSVARWPVGAVTYWHVQVGEHDILLAEGLSVESYLEIGQMSASDAASRIWEAAGCAPLHVTGPEVDAVRALLAGAMAG